MRQIAKTDVGSGAAARVLVPAIALCAALAAQEGSRLEVVLTEVTPAVVDLPVIAATVGGRVVARDGTPVPGAFVFVTGPGFLSGTTATTGADGAFRIDDVAGDDLSLAAFANGRVLFDLPLPIGTDEPTRLGDLVATGLAGSATATVLHGRVVDRSGAPLAGVAVYSRATGRHVVSAATDADGRFAVWCGLDETQVHLLGPSCMFAAGLERGGSGLTGVDASHPLRIDVPDLREVTVVDVPPSVAVRVQRMRAAGVFERLAGTRDLAFGRSCSGLAYQSIYCVEIDGRLPEFVTTDGPLARIDAASDVPFVLAVDDGDGPLAARVDLGAPIAGTRSATGDDGRLVLKGAPGRSVPIRVSAPGHVGESSWWRSGAELRVRLHRHDASLAIHGIAADEVALVFRRGRRLPIAVIGGPLSGDEGYGGRIAVAAGDHDVQVRSRAGELLRCVAATVARGATARVDAALDRRSRLIVRLPRRDDGAAWRSFLEPLPRQIRRCLDDVAAAGLGAVEPSAEDAQQVSFSVPRSGRYRLVVRAEGSAVRYEKILDLATGRDAIESLDLAGGAVEIAVPRAYSIVELAPEGRGTRSTAWTVVASVTADDAQSATVDAVPTGDYVAFAVQDWNDWLANAPVRCGGRAVSVVGGAGDAPARVSFAAPRRVSVLVTAGDGTSVAGELAIAWDDAGLLDPSLAPFVDDDNALRLALPMQLGTEPLVLEALPPGIAEFRVTTVDGRAFAARVDVPDTADLLVLKLP